MHEDCRAIPAGGTERHHAMQPSHAGACEIPVIRLHHLNNVMRKRKLPI